MKKLFNFTLISLIAAGFIILYTPTLRATVTQKLSYSHCDIPITYKIGSIDPKFDLTQTQVLQDAKKATSILNQAEGKNLFAYDPNGQLTVNFKYDQRSALDTTINQLQSNLSSQNKTLQQQIDSYYADSKAFEQKLADFNAVVEKYNQEGGAPPDQFNNLVNQQNQLKAEAQALNDRAKQLKLQTKDYNSGVSSLNQDINKFNTAISLKPEEGVFDPNLETITIYFANNQSELIHTLTHEFGHSLGMQHVSDPNAIMYSYSTESLTVTQDDKQELDAICQEQLLPKLWLDNLTQRLRFLIQGNN